MQQQQQQYVQQLLRSNPNAFGGYNTNLNMEAQPQQPMMNEPTSVELPSENYQYSSKEIGVMMLAFLLFSVAIAVTRSIYNAQMARVPKSNWKSNFKRRLSNQQKKIDLPEAKEKFIGDDEESPDKTSIVKRASNMLFNRKENNKPSERELSNWQIIETPQNSDSKIIVEKMTDDIIDIDETSS